MLDRALYDGQSALPGRLLGCRTGSEVPAKKSSSDHLELEQQALHCWCKAVDRCFQYCKYNAVTEVRHQMASLRCLAASLDVQCKC